MNNLFDRKATFLYGKRGEQFTRIEGLRISFDIKMTSDSSVNKSKFSIYNLSQDTRSKLETEEDLVCLLEVGYQNDVGIIAFTDSTKVTSARKGANIVTTIHAGDGDAATTKATINKSYEGGIDLKTVISDVANTLKDVGGTIVDAVQGAASKINQNGLTVSGASKDILTQLLGKTNPESEWSIQNNELLILEELQTTGEPAVLLTPQTGLIGIPAKRVSKSGGVGGGTGSSKEGAVIQALIMANELRPGRAIQVKSNNIDGIFKILEVQFTGDTHGNTWLAKILGKAIA